MATFELMILSWGEITPVSNDFLSNIPDGSTVDWYWDDPFWEFAHFIHNCKFLEESETDRRNKKQDTVKALLVMVDNRPITPDISIEKAGHFLMNVVLNYEYAKRQGYDLVVINLNSTDLLADVQTTYNISGHGINEELKLQSSNFVKDQVNGIIN